MTYFGWSWSTGGEAWLVGRTAGRCRGSGEKLQHHAETSLPSRFSPRGRGRFSGFTICGIITPILRYYVIRGQGAHGGLQCQPGKSRFRSFELTAVRRLPHKFMPPVSRHQCLVYEGSPAPQLSGLAALIRQKLEENYRCLYLHSPPMVAGMRSYLFAAGADVTTEVMRGRLLLSSDNAHLVDGRFNIDRMLGMLEQALNQALNDGYQGLFATGDMSREFGPERDFSKLLEYEWRLEEFLRTHPALSGICQYHADTLPGEVLRHGLLTHPSLYINETLSRLNPHYVERESFAAQPINNAALDKMIRDLCTVPDTLLRCILPPDQLL